MPKRFTQTEKWSDPWFQDLEGKYKLFWFYICDNCDCAGIWKVNMRLAQFQIGEPMEASELLRVLKDRVNPINSEYWYITKFVQFQYGELSKDCKPHIPVINKLKYYGLEVKTSKGYAKGTDTLEDIDKEKDMDKDKETVEIKPLLFPDPLIREAWKTWTKYKKDQFKFKYKTIETEQIGINDLVRSCDGNYNLADAFVKQSIANGWKGFFPLKMVPVNPNSEAARAQAPKPISEKQKAINAEVERLSKQIRR